LTTELEERALALLARVETLGGAARAIEEGFFQEEIARSAYEYQLRVERGETVVVGVNAFTDQEPPVAIPAPDFRAMEQDQLPCPVCGAIAVRRISAGAGLMFKGSGFYITDYGKDGKKDQSSSRNAASNGDGASAPSSSSESGGGSEATASSESKSSSESKPS